MILIVDSVIQYTFNTIYSYNVIYLVTKVTSNRKHIIKNTVVRKVQTDCIELLISSFTFLRWSKTNSQAINVVISGNLLLSNSPKVFLYCWSGPIYSSLKASVESFHHVTSSRVFRVNYDCAIVIPKFDIKPRGSSSAIR